MNGVGFEVADLQGLAIPSRFPEFAHLLRVDGTDLPL